MSATSIQTRRGLRVLRQSLMAKPVAITKEDRFPTSKQVVALWREMEAAGTSMPDIFQREDIRDWYRKKFERSLYDFAKWVMGFRDLAPLHRELCEWLTNYKVSRRKLLMIPVGHLKTSIVSKAMPLHILIQPADHDIYFPESYSGQRGRNARLVLGAENKEKAAENLSVMREALESNPFIAWLWPEVVWDRPEDASKWTEHAITVPRTEHSSEPSITALGAETPITGRHYDGIFPDDLATIAAGQSIPVMDRAKTWIKRSFTRLHEPYESLHIGVGTHQGPDDVYIDWEKMSSVETVKRAIEEDGKPIWPQRYTPEVIEKLRADTDAITWSLWYMNRPVGSQWTAMDWSELREYRWVNGTSYGFTMPQALEFEEGQKDNELAEALAMMSNPLARFAHGMGPQPVKGNREGMMRRFFGSGMNSEQREFLKEKYASSPAQTAEKERIETILGGRR